MSETAKSQEVMAQAESLPAQHPVTPMQMLQTAVEKGTDLDQLQKLMDLQERWEANEARKAYVAAMAAFKSNPPRIKKNNRVHYETTKGPTDYRHATLDHVSEEVSKAMAPRGLSFRWETEQVEGGQIRVSCVTTHVAGHSERVTLQAGPDQSGGKNNIQAVGSTVTYLQRYTLLSATGLAAEGQDDDGSGANPEPTITDDQVDEIADLLEDTGADRDRFLKFAQADSVEQIPARNYNEVVSLLKRKKQEQSQ